MDRLKYGLHLAVAVAAIAEGLFLLFGIPLLEISSISPVMGETASEGSEIALILYFLAFSVAKIYNALVILFGLFLLIFAFILLFPTFRAETGEIHNKRIPLFLLFIGEIYFLVYLVTAHKEENSSPVPLFLIITALIVLLLSFLAIFIKQQYPLNLPPPKPKARLNRAKFRMLRFSAIAVVSSSLLLLFMTLNLKDEYHSEILNVFLVALLLNSIRFFRKAKMKDIHCFRTYNTPAVTECALLIPAFYYLTRYREMFTVDTKLILFLLILGQILFAAAFVMMLIALFLPMKNASLGLEKAYRFEKYELLRGAAETVMLAALPVFIMSIVRLAEAAFELNFLTAFTILHLISAAMLFLPVLQNEKERRKRFFR